MSFPTRPARISIQCHLCARITVFLRTPFQSHFYTPYFSYLFYLLAFLPSFTFILTWSTAFLLWSSCKKEQSEISATFLFHAGHKLNMWKFQTFPTSLKEYLFQHSLDLFKNLLPTFEKEHIFSPSQNLLSLLRSYWRKAICGASLLV